MKRKKYPPGPSGLPIVGSMLAFRKDPTGFLLDLSHRYGDIAHFTLGRHHAFQLNHPDLIRDVLVTHNSNFHKTRNLVRAKRVMGNGLITSEDDLHRRQRRLIQPAFNRDCMARYGTTMIDCATRTSRRWQGQDHAQVDMYAEMLRLTLGVVGHTLFSADVESEAREIGQAMTVIFEYFNRLMLPLTGMLERLPLASRRRFEKARDLLDQTVYRVIEERRASGRDGGDLLSMLLKAQDTEGDGKGMPERQVRDEIMTAFLAGHETTGAALCWTWYAISQNSEVEAELHAELNRVLAGRVPTVDDFPKLEYTRMVLSESLRMYPPVWTLARRAIRDYEVGGYVLPAGSTIGLCQYVMHRDPRYFPNPEKFDPLRFTPEEAAKRPKFSYFPFGGGPRVCVGEPFALMEGTLVLAALCQNWKARVVPEHNVALQPLITLRPKNGMPMILERRNPMTSAKQSTEAVPV